MVGILVDSLRRAAGIHDLQVIFSNVASEFRLDLRLRTRLGVRACVRSGVRRGEGSKQSQSLDHSPPTMTGPRLLIFSLNIQYNTVRLGSSHRHLPPKKSSSSTAS